MLSTPQNLVEEWDEFLEGREDGLEYEKLGEKKEKTYVIKFWKELPTDWYSRWNEEMRAGIVDGFRIE